MLTSAESISFSTTLGEINGLLWSAEATSDAPTVLALHGWLDNAASFCRLAPQLCHQANVYAIDLPGHGTSDWLPDGGDYYIWQSVASVVEVIDQLPQPLNIVGHSMGAAVALILAASYPEKVHSVVALDAIGPLSTAAQQAPQQLRKGIDEARRRATHGSRLRIFPDIDTALKARTSNDPVLTPECMSPMVERNLRQADEGYHWRTDPRLRHASKVRMTEDMVAAFLGAVECPVCVVRAQRGLIPASVFDLRMPYLKQGELIVSPGHHHFHLDPDTSTGLANTVLTAMEGLW